jgi:hypothetical protein
MEACKRMEHLPIPAVKKEKLTRVHAVLQNNNTPLIAPSTSPTFFDWFHISFPLLNL